MSSEEYMAMRRLSLVSEAYFAPRKYQLACSYNSVGLFIELSLDFLAWATLSRLGGILVDGRH